MRIERPGPDSARERSPITTDRSATLRPRDQITTVIGRVHRAHHAEHRNAAAHQRDGNRVAARAALHGAGAVIRIHEPDALLASVGGFVAGLLAKISPARKGRLGSPA